MSVFRRRKSTSKLRNGVDAGPRLPTSLFNNAAPTRRAASGPPAPTAPSGAATQPQTVRIDDFGRPILDRPAFAAEPAPRREEERLELLYGYGPLGTTVELSVVKVGKIVEACAREIRARGASSRPVSPDRVVWGANSGTRTPFFRPRHAARPVNDGARPDRRERQFARQGVPR